MLISKKLVVQLVNEFHGNLGKMFLYKKLEKIGGFYDLQ